MRMRHPAFRRLLENHGRQKIDGTIKFGVAVK